MEVRHKRDRQNSSAMWKDHISYFIDAGNTLILHPLSGLIQMILIPRVFYVLFPLCACLAWSLLSSDTLLYKEEQKNFYISVVSGAV